jgi:hypothetical protein
MTLTQEGINERTDVRLTPALPVMVPSTERLVIAATKDNIK